MSKRRKLGSGRVDIRISYCGTLRPILLLLHPATPGREEVSVISASRDENLVGRHRL